MDRCYWPGIYCPSGKIGEAEEVVNGRIVLKTDQRQARIRTTKGVEVRKLKVLAAVLAMTLVAAAPAMADTATAEISGVSAEATSSFFGNDLAVADAAGVTATAESSFFGGDVFDDDAFDDDFFDDDAFEDDVFDDFDDDVFD